MNATMYRQMMVMFTIGKFLFGDVNLRNLSLSGSNAATIFFG